MSAIVAAGPRRSAAMSRPATTAASTRIAYNSCRNRHCPKCQGAARAAWLAARQAELLPVPYFHVVFTLPAPIAAIAFQNKAAVYAILFAAAAEALTHARRRSPPSRRRDRRRRRPAHLGPDADASSPRPLRRARRRPVARRQRWIACRPGFFLPVKRAVAALPPPVSRTACTAAFDAGDCASSAISRSLADPRAFASHLADAAARRLGRLCQDARSAGPSRCSPISAATPTASPSPTAASSRSTTDHVAFRWKDYRHDGATKVMTLDADEFIRRFLLHVLPDGFHRIRHYGFLANAAAPPSSPSAAA